MLEEFRAQLQDWRGFTAHIGASELERRRVRLCATRRGQLLVGLGGQVLLLLMLGA